MPFGTVEAVDAPRTRTMNVLVYAGPEVVQPSLDCCLASLKSILTPHYSVQPLSKSSLLSEPWSASCALLVLPKCKQLFVAKSISAFVEDGGAFIALSTTVKCRKAESGDTYLHFFDQSSGLTVQSHFEPPKDAILNNVAKGEGRMVPLLHDPSKTVHLPNETKNIRVLHRYESGEVAALECRINAGKVVLWTAALEAQLNSETATSLSTDASVLLNADEARKALLSESLELLGLTVPQHAISAYRPLPQFLVASPSRTGVVESVLAAINPETSTLEDENDTFQFHDVQDGLKILGELRTQSVQLSDRTTWQPKHIIVGSNKFLPGPMETPLFDMAKFFDSVGEMRKESTKGQWGIGDVAFYGEVVSSTQTMLDKNPKLLSSLPTPLVSIATHQLAGRGRGSNVWLSPAGCLQFSLLLRLPLSSFPASKLVFIQYLFALAVVEACSNDAVLGPHVGKRVRVKWPNDIYAMTGDGELHKIGGILVNTSFSGGKVDIVIGSGLNVLNPAPIMSLSQLGLHHGLCMEKTAAAILTTFEVMWMKFVAERGSFDSFMSLYLERWLHSDQLVTITTMNPPQKVRIAGITPEHGLLRTVPEGGGWGRFVDLQPDGNSFDLMAGLIKAKVT